MTRATVETSRGAPAPICVRCGYDLRGLPTDGVCPECAAPVAWSTGAMLLRFSSGALLRKLWRGAGLAAWAVALEVASIPAAILIILMTDGPGWDGLLVAVIVIAGVLLLAVVSAVLRLAGWWMLTARDDRWSRQGGDPLPRRVARWALLVDLAVVAPAAVLVALALLGGVGVYEKLWQLVPVVLGVHTVAWVVHFFASMVYLRGLAERVPSDFVRRRATVALWLVPVLVVGLGWLWGAGVVMAAVVYCHLLWRLRRELWAIR